MILIGERLNSSRPLIRQALATRNEEFLLEEAFRQKKAGADFLDVNLSALPEHELDFIQWLVPLLQEKVDLPLSLDSPNPKAIEVGLSLHHGRALLNSISLERARWEALLPLVKKYKPFVVALCLDEAGLPCSPAATLTLAERIARNLAQNEIDPSDVFLDPLVRPIGVDYKAGRLFLQSLRLIKQTLPSFRTVAGISNVSFGLPCRSLINRTLLALAVEAGLDAAIIDPCDQEVMATLRAAEALSGQDINLKNYLRYARAQKAQKKESSSGD